MKTHLNLLTPLLILAGLGSCTKVNKDTDVGGDSAACAGPVITSVSEDMSVILGAGAVPLVVEGTVCDDGAATYAWVMESVPVDSDVSSGSLNTTDPTQPSFVPDVVGTYVVSVVLSDDGGNLSAVELITITVASGNSAPIADCGENQDAEASHRVDFDGTGSRDPEGATLEYAWSLSSVPECSALAPGPGAMFNGATASPAMVPDCAGVFVVGLAVSDGEQWSDADYCSVSVTAGDQAPVADAGQSASLSPCADTSYQLNGYGSYDPEGGAITYMWTLVSSPSGSSASDANFSSQTIPNPTFAWDVVGAYTFQLQVNDGTQASPPDIVTYTFTDAQDNGRPIANAGADQTINNTVDCTTASYVFTCEECPEDDVEVDGSASDDPADGDDLSFLWTEPTGEVALSSQYSPVTVVTIPAFASEYGVTLTRSWELELAVSDCADTDEDRVSVTYNCTAEYAP